MKQIYKIDNNKFNSIYVSFNYTMNVNKEELSKSALLASVMSNRVRNIKLKQILKNIFQNYMEVILM